MGGAVFTHAIVEGKHPIAGNIPAFAFFATTIALQAHAGIVTSLPLIVAAHGTFAAAGFLGGYGIVALGAGNRVAKRL